MDFNLCTPGSHPPETSRLHQTIITLITYGSIALPDRVLYLSEFVREHYLSIINLVLSEEEREAFRQGVLATLTTTEQIRRAFPCYTTGTESALKAYLAARHDEEIPCGIYDPSWREYAKHDNRLHISHVECPLCWREALEVFLLNKFRHPIDSLMAVDV